MKPLTRPEPEPDDWQRARQWGYNNSLLGSQVIDLADEFARVREAATKKERERCAKVAESLYDKTYWDDPASGIAAAIRGSR